MTKNSRTINSKEVLDILNYEKNNLKIDLFVKKADGEGTDFYYLGELEPVHVEETKIKGTENKELPIVNIQYKLKNAVREDIYDYLTKK